MGSKDFGKLDEHRTEEFAQCAKIDQATEVATMDAWTPAEEDHQDYLQKNVGGYTCHFLRD